MDYEEYLKQREIIVSENNNLIGTVLNEDEEKLNEILESYKSELIESSDRNRLYKMNLLKDESLRSTRLYQFVKDIPKGSDLHVHATALVPARKLIDFVLSRDELPVDIENSYIHHRDEPGYDKAKCFTLREAFEKNLLTRKELETNWTLLGRTHYQDVWECFENIPNIFS